MSRLRSSMSLLQSLFLQLSLFLIIAFAIGGVCVTVLAAFGVLPWLSLEVGYGETLYPQAGVILQICLTLLAVCLAFYLPANGRILALEKSHRDFNVHMDDVVRAYQLAHAADRSGAFVMASEFDEVKERMMFLKDHPDLTKLEPEVLEVAAQMSQVSKELAELYGDDKVERARTFLTQRQQEIEAFNQRLEDAKIIMHELRQWTRDVDIEESIAHQQLKRLREELFELLPEMSAQLSEQAASERSSGDSIVPLSQKPRKSDSGPSDPTTTL